MKKIISLMMVAVFACCSLALATEDTHDVSITVDGLVCDFCAHALEKSFKKKDEVAELKIDLDTKLVTLDFKEGQALDDEVISELVVNAGYNVVKIERP